MGRDVLVLQLAEIRVPEGRFRALKIDQAAAIGASIAAEGQFDPIAVTRLPGHPDYVLVDGWHRLEGCRIAGIPTIDARLIEAGKAARVKREVLSGLVRAAEDVFDRAAAIDALARLAREEAGVPTVGDLRRRTDDAPRPPKVIETEAEDASVMMTNMLRWDLHVAAQLGLGSRMVRRLAVVHERIPAHLKDKLRELGLANELMPLHELARYPTPFIEKVVEQLTAKVMSIAEAIEIVLARPKVDAFTKFSSAVFRKAQSLTTAQRRDFLADWLQTYHPDGRLRRNQDGEA